jgi:hypothetical protein
MMNMMFRCESRTCYFSCYAGDLHRYMDTRKHLYVNVLHEQAFTSSYPWLFILKLKLGTGVGVAI